MDVLTTGAYGRCGTALIDHLHGDTERGVGEGDAKTYTPPE